MTYNKELLEKLKDNYFKAKALYETIKETAETIERKILSENEFYETQYIADIRAEKTGNRTPERILEPDQTYKFVDNKEKFNEYLSLCYEEYKKAGIANKKGKGYIPYAEEKELLHEAENQLIDYAIDIIPDDFEEKVKLIQVKNILRYRDKILDIILSLE